ncbi:hypothetical protein SKAU_G00185820 [Synaphobranchus kaupii]|uniref:Uncharacterized protein n=1 Tax=Synaphobranchus kaupii TaxID=118154 RepID=A0A9Q1FCF7_SYNKA|nr:hypothetical protein SKAU_G00185820 [Synaphobranchus kaupii]
MAAMERQSDPQVPVGAAEHWHRCHGTRLPVFQGRSREPRAGRRRCGAGHMINEAAEERLSLTSARPVAVEHNAICGEAERTQAFINLDEETRKKRPGCRSLAAVASASTAPQFKHWLLLGSRRWDEKNNGSLKGDGQS